MILLLAFTISSELIFSVEIDEIYAKLKWPFSYSVSIVKMH